MTDTPIPTATDESLIAEARAARKALHEATCWWHVVTVEDSEGINAIAVALVALSRLAEALDARGAECERQAREIASLRASLGDPTGAEPVGCPCPDACSATALQATLAEATRKLDAALADARRWRHWRSGYTPITSAEDIDKWIDAEIAGLDDEQRAELDRP